MGISVYKNPNVVNSIDSFMTINDVVGILDRDGSVLYQQTLTQNVEENRWYGSGGCPFFEIYFEAPITVTGDYYVFYSYADSNVAPNICIPLIQNCFPLTILTSENYTPNDHYLVRIQGTNSWITFSEFKSYTNYLYSGSIILQSDSITDDLGIFPIL